MIRPQSRGRKPRLVRPAGILASLGIFLSLALFGVIPSNVVKIRPTPLGELAEPPTATLFASRNAPSVTSGSTFTSHGISGVSEMRQLVLDSDVTPRTSSSKLYLPQVNPQEHLTEPNPQVSAFWS